MSWVGSLSSFPSVAGAQAQSVAWTESSASRGAYQSAARLPMPLTYRPILNTANAD